MPKIKTHSGAKKRFKLIQKRKGYPCTRKQISHFEQENNKT